MDARKPVTRWRFILAGLGIVAVVAVFYAIQHGTNKQPEKSFVISQPNNTASPTPTASPALLESLTPMEPSAPSFYTRQEVALHDSATNCWTIIKGGVYNLTSAVDKHPGGKENIIRLCGKDGTEAFASKHGDQEKPKAWLETLKIGVVTTPL